VLEEPTTCRSGAPTQDGSNSSSMKEKDSSTGRTIKYLMSMEARMKKEDQLSSGTSTMEPTKSGRLYILTKLRKNKLKDLM
jgi:hypothetical protein